MRFPLSCVIGRVWAVLATVVATVACTPVATSTPNQVAESVRVAGPPLPGAPAGVTAFVDVAVVPMDQERVLYDQTVLVEGGRITTLGPVHQVHVPAGALQIDGRGKFLLPGLADMHAHLFLGVHIGTIPGPMALNAPEADSAGAVKRLFLWVTNGVTTVRDMDYYSQEFGEQALRWRAVAASGQSWIPRIYTAGLWGPYRYIGHPELDGNQPVALDKVAGYIAAYKAAGYDFVKIHDETPAVIDSVLAAAKRVGIPVAGHVPPPARVEHVLWGYKSIEHPLTDYLWNQRTAASSPKDTAGIAVLAGAMGRAGVWSCPTQSHYDRLHLNPPKLLKVLQDSGVKLLLGTDELPWQGVITRELQALVGAGLTPYQALLTGTRNVAVYFGTLDESGTITAGKRADMILLTGNPLQDVRYTAQPAGVMMGGRWLPRAEIDRRLAGLTLATVTGGDAEVTVRPVKSYWSNVVDEFVGTAAKLFGDMYYSDSTPPKLEQLGTAFQAQRQALIDSLGESNQYAAGTQRVLRLVAQQLGEFRMQLAPEQRATFDQKARGWIQRRKVSGYVVEIPGVQP